jgi:REP element-mobilizing transposase RayT
MASTLTQILIHITFSTKNRIDLVPPELEPDLYAYTGGICRRLKSPLLAMNGTANYVHMYVSLSKNIALANLMLELKRDTSSWMKERVPKFKWRVGYFAFSIGESVSPRLRRYIANQKEHHRGVDFKDEVRDLLRKYKMEWDERYIWE